LIRACCIGFAVSAITNLLAKAPARIASLLKKPANGKMMAVADILRAVQSP
jgi:hypothetical protein